MKSEGNSSVLKIEPDSICHPELSINKDDVAQEVADEVAKAFQNKCFDQRPPASVIAQKERNKIPENPTEKYIKLS